MTTTVTRRYYPRLSELIQITDLPAYLQFIQTGANAVFSNLHYKNLQYSKSVKGDGAFYSLDIVSAQKLSIPIPGGMELVLNPDYDTNISSIPISVQYQWGILSYLKNFDLKSFDFSTKSLYHLGLQVFSISEEELIGHTLNHCVEYSATQPRYKTLIQNINGRLSTNILIPDNEESLSELVYRIKSQGKFNIPLSDVIFETYLKQVSDVLTALAVEDFFSIMMPNGIEAYLRSLITPSFKASLKLSLALEFPRHILTPVYDGLGNHPTNPSLTPSPKPAPYSVIPPDANGSPKVLLRMGEAMFYVDSDTGLGYSTDISLSTNLPAQIGNTGFIINLSQVKLDFSTKTNIPEATADGRPDDFVGIFIEEAEVILPSRFKKVSTSSISETNPIRKIVGRNMLAGTGGFSGYVGLETNVSGAIPFKIGNFEIAITEVALNFHMNKLLNSKIDARLKIPQLGGGGAAKIVDVSVFIKDLDNFKIVGNFKANPILISCFNVFDFQIDTLSYEEVNNRKGIGLSGVLSFKDDIAGLGSFLPKNIAIEKLIIYDDGDIDFRLGSITMPPFNLELGAVKVGVHGLSFTVSQLKNRKYGVISFDGNINTGSAGVNGQANGVKLYFSIDNGPVDIFLKVESIRVSIRIPGDATPEEANVLIEGFISVKNTNSSPSAPTEYGGGISISLNDLGISAGAAIKMTPSIPNFIVDLGVDLNVPIPLGPTGLGIYGFRGLIGHNYHVNRLEGENWWKYYKRLDPREGVLIDSNKFIGDTGFNLGAGVTIGTMGDSGYSVNSKIFVMLGLPKLLLLQGQTAIMKKRLGLNDPQDPPFVSFLAIDEESIWSGLGVNYLSPTEGEDAGSVLRIQGLAEMAFFFKDSSAWFVNFGREFPVEDRIRAKIFELVDAYAYLMLNKRGIKAGAGASMGVMKKIGPVKIGATLSNRMGGEISYKPFQIGGFMEVAGEAAIRVYKFGFSIALRAVLAAEAPKPFIIKGYFEVSIGLPFPFDDVNLSVELEWKKSNRTSADTSPIPLLDSTTAMPVSALSMQTKESFKILLQQNTLNLTGIDWDEYTIPMDSYIDIDFTQTPMFNLTSTSNVKVGGIISGSDHFFLSPPVKSFSNQNLHRFVIDKIVVKYLNPNTNTWANYNIWEQVATHLPLLATVGESSDGKVPLTLAQLTALPNASIQQVLPGESRKTNKLRILAQDMFSFVNQTSPGSIKLESFNVDARKLFCSKSGSVLKTINWETNETGLLAEKSKSLKLDENVSLLVEDSTSEVIDKTDGYLPFQKALKIKTKKGLELYMDKPLSNISFKFSLDTSDIYYDATSFDKPPRNAENRFTLLSVHFYQKQNVDNDLNGYPIYKFIEIGKRWFIPQDLNWDNVNINFTAPTGKIIDKIVIKCVNNVFQSPTANGLMMIGNSCFYDNEVFKGTIADVKLFGIAPNNNIFNPNSLKQIGLWTLQSNLTLSNTALINVPPNANVTYDSFIAVNGNNRMGIHLNSLVPFLRSSSGTGTINNKTYLSFNNPNNGVRIPLNQYSTDPQYDAIPSYYLQGNIDSYWTQELWEVFRAPLPYQKITESYAVGITATILTSDNSPERRVIVDKRMRVFWPNEYDFGYTMYLLDNRLHIDIVYDEVFTYRHEGFVLSDGIPKTVGFVYDPKLQTLRVFVGTSVTTVPVVDFIAKRTGQPKSIYLQEISYTTAEDQLIQSTMPSAAQLQTQLTDIENGLKNSIQPIWRPDTKFAIEIAGKHQINENISHPQTYHLLFRTKGPVGFIHEYKEDYSSTSEAFKRHKKFGVDKPDDEINLAHLKYYLDREASSPDIDGNIIYVKPLFTNNPRINLQYLVGYARLLFATWPAVNGLPERNYRLKCSIIDPETKAEVPSTLLWKVNRRASQTPGVTLWNKLLTEGFDCVTSGGNINQLSYQAEFTINQQLKPEKIYELNVIAVLQVGSSAVEQKVHTLTFKTSKYPDLVSQFATYQLGVSQKAQYELKANLTTTEVGWLTNLLNSMRDRTYAPQDETPALSNQLKELLPKYNSKFELLSEHIISEIKTLNKPLTTEVIKIVNEANTTLYGLLLRSDEPLCNPMLNDILLMGSTQNAPVIEVLNSSNVVVPATIIFAKDCSSVFISISSITTGMSIRINNYEFNVNTDSFSITSTNLIAL
ncbi:MAG: hypothetical protein MUC81_00830 [Bacteroidia bacterium]|jgi:hypothetical protein|nr:hypothetical protein [Bacteroidia bacterium]